MATGREATQSGAAQRQALLRGRARPGAEEKTQAKKASWLALTNQALRTRCQSETVIGGLWYVPCAWRVCVSVPSERDLQCGCCCRVRTAAAVLTGSVWSYRIGTSLITWCNLREVAHPDLHEDRSRVYGRASRRERYQPETIVSGLWYVPGAWSVCVFVPSERDSQCGCCCRVWTAAAVLTGVSLLDRIGTSLTTWCNLRELANPDHEDRPGVIRQVL